MRNLDRDNQLEQSSPTVAKRIGQTILSISATYIALKVGEDYLNFALPDYVELAIAGGVGSATMNGRFASK